MFDWGGGKTLQKVAKGGGVSKKSLKLVLSKAKLAKLSLHWF